MDGVCTYVYRVILEIGLDMSGGAGLLAHASFSKFYHFF